MRKTPVLWTATAIALFAMFASSARAEIAYNTTAGTAGSQELPFPFVLGLDFDVDYTINVTSLGVFDSLSDGFFPGATLTTELWSRDTGTILGTSRNAFLDDVAGTKLASAQFTSGDPGALIGGNRFKSIGGVVLPPGSYSIVSYGRETGSFTELNANLGVADFPRVFDDGGGAIRYAGYGRYYNGSVDPGPIGSTIGTTVDFGPAYRFGAGTFEYTVVDAPPTPVTLQNATAVYSQAALTVAQSIDGIFDYNPADSAHGWANDVQGDNTAVYETATDVGFAGGTEFTFKLLSGGYGQASHTAGRFRISVTTDDRSTFADGLQNGGDVSANWTVLEPDGVSTDNGNQSYNGWTNDTQFTILPDGSILASGDQHLNAVETYYVKATTDLTGITGIRLEMITDPSLPLNNGGFNGPGRSTTSGNYVLREFFVGASPIPIPEPSTATLALLGAVGLFASRRRQAAARSRAGAEAQV